jgi:hypothetical protein
MSAIDSKNDKYCSYCDEFVPVESFVIFDEEGNCHHITCLADIWIHILGGCSCR